MRQNSHSPFIIKQQSFSTFYGTLYTCAHILHLETTINIHHYITKFCMQTIFLSHNSNSFTQVASLNLGELSDAF